jgi:long-chain acyl-CoA synthetase
MERTPRNLAELAADSCQRFAERLVFGTKRDGRWAWISYRELGELIDHCRAGLHSLGVGSGDVVGIVSENSVEWAAACYATAGLEAALVPLYPAQRPTEWQFILQDSGAKVVLARTGKPYASVTQARAELPRVEHVIGLGLPASDPNSFDALLDAGARAPIAPRTPDPTCLAGLIYTSGTTGKPKGVMLSHANITSNAVTGREIFPLSPDDRLLSFLPWAHSYGQLELHWALCQGSSLALNDDVKDLISNLAEVKPTVLVTVPRVFHRLYGAVSAQLAGRPHILQKLFDDGIRSAIRKRRGEPLGVLARLELGLDNKLFFSKIRDRFGGRLKYVISASAALGMEVAQFVDALGLEVFEGYGLTETSPMVSANTPRARRLGSVGKVIPGVRVEIDTTVSAVAGQGEIIVYGPNVMLGYHERPEENAKVFTPDGGVRTGDLGYLDADGFLFITGRTKEQYKLENGKYVMPGPLEEQLKLSPYVANIMLHGANRPFNVALVVIEPTAISAWAQERGFQLADPCSDPRVEELILSDIRRWSSAFRSFEVPRRVQLIAEDFTTDNDLLTPTLKLKRRNVELRYAAALEALYGKLDTVVSATV